MSQRLGFTNLANQRVWHLIDCMKDTRSVGRIAQDAVNRAMGKNKPTYYPTVDSGDYVVIINCNNLEFTNAQLRGKFFYRPSTFPGNLKKTSLKEKLFEKGPKWVMYRSIYRMFPKNKLKHVRAKRIFCFDGDEYPYRDNIIAFAKEQGIVEEEKKKCEEITAKIIESRKKYNKIPELMKNLKL
ncbi:hypothetical protein FOG51_03113 [Hanseniaspora uvarum]|jgi:large subunit ribosomal protein L13|nr:hypothetical protein FOG51_03113 [Hanseniaspora uvarum]KAF0275175.1 hypothetical protein FOG50_03903 [Hanseniaspora uvarum]KKA03810.1 54S ribosomal protein L23, mitochondrial [Hanseniaspora uvarum DSM 2768]